MNNKRTKRLPRIILNQFLVAFLMTAIAISVLFFAEGYRFNFKNFKIIKTGILYFSTDPDGATVFINGKLQDKKTPYAVNLTAGRYNATIEKNGYGSWSSGFKVDSGLVSEFESIVLFKKNPEISNLSDQRKIDLLNSPLEYLATSNSKNELYQNGYEVWQSNSLVTRFSTPIKSVSWYPDLKHILYQQGDEIRVMEITGLNDVLLVKLSTKTPVRYIANNKGDELYYLDNDQYKAAKIK